MRAPQQCFRLILKGSDLGGGGGGGGGGGVGEGAVREVVLGVELVELVALKVVLVVLTMELAQLNARLEVMPFSIVDDRGDMPMGGLDVLIGASVVVLEVMIVVSEAPDLVVVATPMVEFRMLSGSSTVV